MRKIPALTARLTALAGASLLLAACGSYDDASTEANADTVEMPADEALSAVEEQPVADPAATATDAPVEEVPTAEAAADAAANVAEEAAAAAEAADAASE